MAASIDSVRPGQRIKYLRPNGIGRNGREYKVATGTVAMNRGTHLVLNTGGRYGRAAVVTPENFSGLA